MKNLIIGSGVVGLATGIWLEANGEDVIYYDINHERVMELVEKGYNATEVEQSDWDIAWICTHEDHAFRAMPTWTKEDSVIVIRSTVTPDFFSLFNKYELEKIVHMPEFLTEAEPLEGTFFPDRIVIGAPLDSVVCDGFEDFIASLHPTKNVVVVPLEISSYIKIIANAWLSTQISFWNEVYRLLDKTPEYRQIIADVITTDKRISNYGSKMIGKSFGGKCLPKDLDHIIQMCNRERLFSAVKSVNEEMVKHDNKKKI